MKIFKRSAGLLSSLIIGLTVNIGSAQSAVVYDWSGTCELECTGTATAVLTLTDAYTPNNALANSHFLSFSFSSSSLSYNVPGDAVFTFITGFLPNGVGSPAIIIDFAGADTIFLTSAVSWFSELGNPFASGGQNQWSLRVSPSPVPLPASAWMFISSLLAFGVYGWWRRRRIAAAA